jgi:two-component system, NtrC family, sensor kinase
MVFSTTLRSRVEPTARPERRTIHIPDVIADPEYTYGAKQVDPIRMVLTVPMLRAGELLGALLTCRHEARSFADNQIALLESFAYQAAIAIENTRLFEQVQARNRNLTALGEVNATRAMVLWRPGGTGFSSTQRLNSGWTL